MKWMQSDNSEMSDNSFSTNSKNIYFLINYNKLCQEILLHIYTHLFVCVDTYAKDMSAFYHKVLVCLYHDSLCK